MRKVKIIFALCAAVLSAVGYFGYQRVSVSSKSDLFLANIEALSETESGAHRMKCYTSLVYEEGSSVVECSTCKLVENHSDAWYNFHDWCE